MSDTNRIVRNILEGNPEGLNRLVALYGGELAEYVRLMSGDEDAKFRAAYEDVLVDIISQIRLAIGRKNGNMRKFLFESAANTLRRRHAWIFERRPKAPEESDIGRVKGLEPSRDDARQALMRLAPEHRELLALRLRFKFSYDDISDVIRLGRVNFEDRLLDARMQFRSEILRQAAGK